MRSRLVIAAKLFGVLLSLYALLRLAFLLVYFSGDKWSFTQLAKLFYWGARLDFAALFYVNIPFLLYFLLAGPFIRSRYQARMAVGLFSLCNIPFLALAFIDLAYFRYNHRRSTTDLGDVFGSSSSAFGAFAAEYWYLLLLFVLVSVLLVTTAGRIIRSNITTRLRLVHTIVMLLVLALAAGIARGFSDRPILPSTPLLYFDARYQPLVNNSTFNFLYSAARKQTSLERKNYFTPSQLDSIFSIQRQYAQDSPFQKRNVVIFVLESFSKEFFKGGGQQAKMPFLDSLMQHSTVCNNAFGNALESNKGLPAILASLPDIMDEPVYLSNYSNLGLRGLGHILKEEGYNTSFFMGAGYDHFGFAKLCKMVGIDHYYSRATYGGHPGEYDGTWGIYDEYFFRYFGNTVSGISQPFFSVLFNLSSHPPYKIPAETAKKIHVDGQYPGQDSKTYVDHCFRQLFAQVSNQPWFHNTIFVFVADHGYRFTRQPDEILKEIRIPLFIYDPMHPEYHSIDRVVKQLDIVPSVLDKLHYAGRFTGFGSSIYRPDDGFSVNRLNGVFQYIDSTDFIGYDDRNEREVFHYKYRQDPLLQQNLSLSGDTGSAGLLNRLKAFLQSANNSLIDNKLNK